MYSTAAVTSNLSGLEGIAVVLPLIVWVIALFVLIAWAKMFKKAGLPWERIFVPVYGPYWSYKVVGAQKQFWANIILCVALVVSSVAISLGVESGALIVFAVIELAALIGLLVVYCVYCVKISKAFGHGGAFAVGLILLNFVFVMILGFGSSEYKNAASAEVVEEQM